MHASLSAILIGRHIRSHGLSPSMERGKAIDNSLQADWSSVFCNVYLERECLRRSAISCGIVASARIRFIAFSCGLTIPFRDASHQTRVPQAGNDQIQSGLPLTGALPPPSMREHAEQSGTSRPHVQVVQPREYPRPAFAYQQAFHVVPIQYGPRNSWHRLRSKSSMERTETKQCAAWPFSHSSSERRSLGPLVPPDQILWSKAKCLVPVLNWLACVAMVPNLCPRLSVPIILDAPRFITPDALS